MQTHWLFETEAGTTMAKGKQNIWFPAKKYGWGWGLPCAWQGWAVMFVYLGLIVTATLVIKPAANLKLYSAIILGLSILFCLACWWKGERPSWRWGG